MLPGSAKTYRYKYFIRSVFLPCPYYHHTSAWFLCSPRCRRIPHCCHIPTAVTSRTAATHSLLSYPPLLSHTRTAVASRTAVTFPHCCHTTGTLLRLTSILHQLPDHIPVKVICIIMAVLAPIGSCSRNSLGHGPGVSDGLNVGQLFCGSALTNIRTAVSIIGSAVPPPYSWNIQPHRYGRRCRLLCNLPQSLFPFNAVTQIL